MAVQQNKVSRSRRNNRRAYDPLVAGNPNECPNCGELKRPHHVVHHGHYGDREVVALTEEIDWTTTHLPRVFMFNPRASNVLGTFRK